MKQVKDLTRAEKVKMIDLADDWKLKHEKHVWELRKGYKEAYPPAGSDMFRPELWKGAHWNWFEEEA